MSSGFSCRKGEARVTLRGKERGRVHCLQNHMGSGRGVLSDRGWTLEQPRSGQCLCQEGGRLGLPSEVIGSRNHSGSRTRGSASKSLSAAAVARELLWTLRGCSGKTHAGSMMPTSRNQSLIPTPNLPASIAAAGKTGSRHCSGILVSAGHEAW